MTNSAEYLPESASQDEPVFQAPWEAHAFAMVNQLASANHWSWSEWTDYLVKEISAVEREAPGSKTYYEQWVAVCEKLLIEKNFLDSEEIQAKIAELLAAQQADQH